MKDYEIVMEFDYPIIKDDIKKYQVLINKDKTKVIFIKKEKDNIIEIGYAKLQKIELDKKYEPLYELKEFYIKEEYRNKGFGSFMFHSIFCILEFNLLNSNKVFLYMKNIYKKYKNIIKYNIINEYNSDNKTEKVIIYKNEETFC